MNPSPEGRYGRYGGKYVPETLIAPLVELESAYRECQRDPAFGQELQRLLRDFVGRPTPLTRVDRLAQLLGIPARIYLKREDLTHTGAHKINNSVGQILLARRMGKTRIVAETGAGQHGVATATAAALFGMECVIYMGEVDMERQALNVHRMRLLGARVVGVASGSRTLKDAINEAMRDWITEIRTTHYLLGSVLGPHPYPEIVRDFQSVIGREARAQILECEKRLPTELIACVGGGSNAIGLFYEFLNDSSVRMVGVEAGGFGIESGKHAARFQTGVPGVFHGTMTQVLQDRHGQIQETHSISAGLDYQAVGPEHAMLREAGRVGYSHATDEEALAAFHFLGKTEGILPALESSHALAYLIREKKRFRPDDLIIVNLSGRGDKDLGTVMEADARAEAKARAQGESALSPGPGGGR